MSDLIRKAVELADGWLIETHGTNPTSNFDYVRSLSGYRTTIDSRDEIIDALAAQLVRQVDEIEDQGIVFRISSTHAQILDQHNRVMLSEEQGHDRTLNTIKAIVESKVLEQSDE